MIAEGSKPAGEEASYEGQRKLGEMIKYSGAGDRLAKLLAKAQADIVPGDIRVSCCSSFILDFQFSPMAASSSLCVQLRVCVCECV